ncbi:MAG: nucleoside deaminase [Xanthomonadales bacterium]|nr:nucleoside deaminase [Xanthomonadales bacterium]
MSFTYPTIELELPAWMADFISAWDRPFATAADRMHLAIALSAENVRRGTGGPFGAAVFSMDEQRLVAPGVNIVTTANVSCAHAEIMAITMAQQIVGNFDLSSCGEFELVASTAPCAMCLGSIPWSGIKRLVCGASGADAEAIGFDEGAKPLEWQERLQERGIEVLVDVEREAAASVLTTYAAGGGEIYNAGGAN